MITAIQTGHRGLMTYKPTAEVEIGADAAGWVIHHPILGTLPWSRGAGFTAAPFTNLQAAALAAVDLGLLPKGHTVDLALVEVH